MSITLPNLDDREFADMVAEAKGMIPQLAPSWTDHNHPTLFIPFHRIVTKIHW